MRTIHTMFHSTSLTPLSSETNGRRLANSSGTRHHSGPAGPIMTPTTTAATTDAEAIANHRPLPGCGTATSAGTAGGAVPAPYATVGAERAGSAARSAGGDEGLLDGIMHLLGVLDDAGPPA